MQNKFVIGQGDFGKSIIDALGLEGRRINRIVIDIPADGCVEVSITELLEQQCAPHIEAALTQYRLVAKE